MAQRRYTHSSNHTTSTRGSRRSAESCDSRSTAPTSLYDSPRPSTRGSSTRAPRPKSVYYEDEEDDLEEDEDEAEYSLADDDDEPERMPVEDLSPATKLCHRSARDTYSSLASSVAIDDEDETEEVCIDYDDEVDIPPLPIYRHEIEEVNVRPSTPDDFAHLFPSMDRLSIRHDDFTPDGNMNLRVDTVVHGRRKRTIQLFHLRMYDLNKREFSLRRYCRDSGREVCNSKRRYVDANGAGRMAIQRSVSNAMRSLSVRPQNRRRASTASSIKSRPGTSHSVMPSDDPFDETFDHALTVDKRSKSRQIPTDTIKLEFSNYARIDVDRQGNLGSKRYEFEWWGHKYTWKRVADKHTGVVSFHLFRDGNGGAAVAHIVPETRSPNQVAMDEYAGGWVPPCHMWISDKSILKAMTDVADIIVSTGLMALVDDCIKSRWHNKTGSHVSLEEAGTRGPRAFVQQLLARRYSETGQSSPLRYQQQLAAH